ncbi:expressed unknown protein [Seminavis robusta]|uniref:MYND-type domain-containing protein n=1 Tax=Seminavis robusta TaxID=568900 RepID=A0A9N8EG71_9STRA|nr:expressed unknown protein [Seminavis robusta]|eukprot:Sro952_g224040.1 n/a (263) ;mRNA; f:18770-19558
MSATTRAAASTDPGIIATKDNWFSPDFDEEQGQSLIQAVQESIGCFECGEPNAKLRCSRCKLAKYCSPACQRADWKKSHKQLCSMYLENKEPRGNTPGAPIPILLRNIGLIGEENFEVCIQNRRALFLQAASRSSKKPLPMSFSCAIVPTFQQLRLVIAASFQDDKDKFHEVPHLLFDVIEEEPDAIQKFEQQPHCISVRALHKVAEAWVEFYVQLEDANIHPLAITCGAGLHDRIDDLQEKLTKKGVSGLGFVPSEQLLME